MDWHEKAEGNLVLLTEKSKTTLHGHTYSMMTSQNSTKKKKKANGCCLSGLKHTSSALFHPRTESNAAQCTKHTCTCIQAHCIHRYLHYKRQRTGRESFTRTEGNIIIHKVCLVCTWTSASKSKWLQVEEKHWVVSEIPTWTMSFKTSIYVGNDLTNES